MVEEFPTGLRDADTQVQDALRRVDSKATALLTLFGAALAGVVALAARHPAGAGAVLLWLSLAPIGAAVTLLLLTIRPQLTPRPAPGTWLYAAQVGPATLLKTYTPDRADLMGAAEHVCELARIARTKYRRVRTAVALLLTGLLPLVTSVLITTAA
jgi:hypothetical protein